MLNIPRCNRTFQDQICGCRHWGPLVVTVVYLVGVGSTSGSCRSDQHWFRHVTRHVAWVWLPRCSTDALQQSEVASLLFWDSSRGLNNIGPSLVHDNALSCLHSHTHKHTSRPPRLQLVSSVLSVVYTLTKARHLNSPGLAFQAHVGCVTIVRFTLVIEKEMIGPMLNQPGQQRASGFQGDTRPLLQEVFESSRQSMHRLARSTSPLLLLSPLGDASGTISPCQLFLTASQRAILGS